ncbi:signal peptidase II [Saccharopolyspora tripterygii]
MTTAASSGMRASRTRLALTGTALVLAVGDLGLKVQAARTLADGRVIDLGVLQLRLAFNPGVAFSLGNTLPSVIVLAVTGLIVAALTSYALAVR